MKRTPRSLKVSNRILPSAIEYPTTQRPEAQAGSLADEPQRFYGKAHDTLRRFLDTLHQIPFSNHQLAVVYADVLLDSINVNSDEMIEIRTGCEDRFHVYAVRSLHCALKVDGR